jgi:hypothetical protein
MGEKMAGGRPDDTEGMILKLPKGARLLLEEEARLRKLDVQDLILSLIVTGWFKTWEQADPRRAALMAQEFIEKDLGIR